MPGPNFLREKPTEKGYWGFVRSKKDYEYEKEKVLNEFKSLVDSLKREGYDIELLPHIEISCTDEGYAKVYKLSEELLEADINVVLPFSFHRPCIEAITALSKNTIIFDKFNPMYSGTLFAPPLVKEYEQYGFRNLSLIHI